MKTSIAFVSAGLLLGAACRDNFSRRVESTIVDLDVTSVPLSDAIEALRRRGAIDIRLVGETNPIVSLKVSQVRLKAALALLLTPMDFSYRIRDSAILVGPRNCAAFLD